MFVREAVADISAAIAHLEALALHCERQASACKDAVGILRDLISSGTSYEKAGDVSPSDDAPAASPAKAPRSTRDDMAKPLLKLLASGASLEAREMVRGLRSQFADVTLAEVVALAGDLVSQGKVERIFGTNPPRYRRKASG